MTILLQILEGFFLISGLVLVFFGSLGSIILPDLFQRFHAATKCGVSGSISIIIGLALGARQTDFSLKFVVIVIFLVFTAPIVAHVLAVSRMDERVRDDNDDSV